jgi:hypothetical protein
MHFLCFSINFLFIDEAVQDALKQVVTYASQLGIQNAIIINFVPGKFTYPPIKEKYCLTISNTAANIYNPYFSPPPPPSYEVNVHILHYKLGFLMILKFGDRLAIPANHINVALFHEFLVHC